MNGTKNGLHPGGIASSRDSLELLLREQINDWLHGDCRPLNVYLERQPSVLDDSEAMVELINQHALLRRRKGETPIAEDYLADYPHLAAPLSQLFAVHDALSVPTESHPSRSFSFTQENELEHAGSGIGAPRIPGYRIGRMLGSGAMGIVYLADELTVKRKVALKVLRPGIRDDPGHRARFEREAAAAAKCQHPNLVQIFQIGRSQGEFFLALEYVEGDTLASTLAGSPQPARGAATLAEKLARAIDHAHRNGVIHRDLKPANILLTRLGEPKITDFGLARLDDASARTDVGTILGTLAYMAPEQARAGSSDVGPAADIHAVGAILYEALTGRPPYRADTAEETLQKILFEDVGRPSFFQPETPRDLEAICLKCLEKRPRDRYQTAVELAEDLRRYLDCRPVMARPVRFWDRSWRWCRRNPRLAAVSAALAATLVLSAAAILGLSFRHHSQLKAEVAHTSAKATEAGRNYQEARKALRSMLTTLNDRRYAHSARLIELRHDLQESALAFYQRALDQNTANDPLVREDTATALLEAFMLQHSLGQKEQKERSVRRAIKLVEVLLAQEPDNLRYVSLQVDCLVKLASCLIDSDQAARAIATGRQAVELAERAARAAPENLPVQDHLAVSHTTVGNALLTAGSADEALTHFDAATKIRKRINPAEMPEITGRLAESIMNQGVILWGRNPAQAEQRFLQADRILKSMPAAEPDPERLGEALVTRIRIAVNLSGLLSDVHRYHESITWAESGLNAVEPYLRTEPNAPELRELCLELHGNRARARSGLKLHRESADDWSRVVELSGQQATPGYRIQLALALVRAGALDGAAEQARLFLEVPDLSGLDRYNIGAYFALRAEATGADPHLSADERSRRAELQVSDALYWLRRAAEAGLFRDLSIVDRITDDSDVNILRNHPEFRRLVGIPTVTR